MYQNWGQTHPDDCRKNQGSSEVGATVPSLRGGRYDPRVEWSTINRKAVPFDMR